MAEPTEAMRQHIAALRALRAKAGGGAAGSGPGPAGTPAQRGPQGQAPAATATPVGLPWSPPARPGAADVTATRALSGLRAEPTPGPAPPSAGPAAGPAAVNLGPVASLDGGAPGTDALLAAGDRDAAAAAQQRSLDRRARVLGTMAFDPHTDREPSTLDHIAAGLDHGIGHLGTGIERATIAASNFLDARVPLLDKADRAIGSTPETRAARVQQMDDDEARYQAQHGGSRAAGIADTTGQVITAGAATVATGGLAAVPEMAAGRAALGQTARAVPRLFGQSAQTFTVNAGVGCVSGGVSGGLSDGWRGAGIGCGAGAVTNVAAPAAATWAARSIQSGGGGAFAQGATFGATYTGINAFSGGATQYAANTAMSRPAWENVPRAAALGGLTPLASGDAAISSVTAATARGGARMHVPEIGNYALTTQTGIFGVGATVATNSYDARQQAAAEADAQNTGIYISPGAFSASTDGGNS